jgi:hypothetical protein
MINKPGPPIKQKEKRKKSKHKDYTADKRHAKQSSGKSDPLPRKECTLPNYFFLFFIAAIDP